jgi:hypothetical protein
MPLFAGRFLAVPEKPTMDWQFIGSVILLTTSILGFAYVLWNAYATKMRVWHFR